MIFSLILTLALPGSFIYLHWLRWNLGLKEVICLLWGLRAPGWQSQYHPLLPKVPFTGVLPCGRILLGASSVSHQVPTLLSSPPDLIEYYQQVDFQNCPICFLRIAHVLLCSQECCGRLNNGLAKTSISQSPDFVNRLLMWFRDFADVINLRGLRWRDYPGLPGWPEETV